MIITTNNYSPYICVIQYKEINKIFNNLIFGKVKRITIKGNNYNNNDTNLCSPFSKYVNITIFFFDDDNLMFTFLENDDIYFDDTNLMFTFFNKNNMSTFFEDIYFILIF